jgi:uncharacterized membrane-anchored protein
VTASTFAAGFAGCTIAVFRIASVRFGRGCLSAVHNNIRQESLKPGSWNAGGVMSVHRSISMQSLISTCIACSVLLAGSVMAQEQAPAAADPNAAVWKAAGEAMIHGPQSVTLQDQAKIELPAGYGFVPQAQATKVMEAMGNQVGSSFMGMIFPEGDEDGWFVTVDFERSGYIKDDEAKDWDADGLLENLKEGTEAGNEHREQIGAPPIKVTRWIEKPAYDAAAHQLVWSAEIRLKDGEDPDPGVNYNTYVLGREGYISLDLVTSLSSVEAQKPAARQLLAAVNFNEGKRYGDFNSSTDKVAAYGVAALVGGLVAKKLGLLAVVAAFFVKFAKLILVGIAAGGAGIAKWWKGRSQPQE